MKNPPLHFLLVGTLAFLPARLQAGERPTADIYETSFEEEQGISLGWIQNQQGWTTDRTMQNLHEVNVVAGGAMDLPAPSGLQMLRVAKGTAHTNLPFAKTALQDFFEFSVLMTQEPEDPKKTDCAFYLGNGVFKFAGVSFGTKQQEGEPVFFYRDGEDELVLASGHKPEAGVFYRFEADVDIGMQSYTVKVFEHAGNKLLGEAVGKFRGEMRKMDNLLIGATPNTYIDDIWINSQPR